MTPPTWEQYVAACRDSELPTLAEQRLRAAGARATAAVAQFDKAYRAWGEAQRARIEMARELRESYVKTLGASKSILAGGDDDL